MIKWMFSQLPMYQRVGAVAYKASLANTLALCDLLGNPQHAFPSIHVAGTNGKGSVCHLLASILQEHGLKTGLYTSPHLRDFRERIRINGEMIPLQAVTGFVKEYRPDFERIRPSFFEMTVGLAFDHFRREQVDMAVLEVGMGGRLDSTNVITPLISVITNISFDHMQFLGDTLEKIAAEKAGIIKPGVPVVIGETQPETAGVFISRARECGSAILFADQLPGYQIPDRGSSVRHPASGFMVPLQGRYQGKNLRTALAVIDVLNRIPSGIRHHRHGEKRSDEPAGSGISKRSIRRGISNVIINTGLKGRWQVLAERPLTICDTGHNEAGIREVVAQLSHTPCHHLHMVFGQVNDKESGPILALLPRDATYYFCKANIPRGLDAGELQARAETAGLRGKSYSSVRKALAAARTKAGTEDLIFVGGSTFVVAEVVT